MSSSLPQDPYMHETQAGDLVALTFQSLNELQEIDRVRDASAGAICSFIGTTRDSFEGKAVTKLEYEAYASMALKTMASIVDEAKKIALAGSFSFEWPYYPSATSLISTASRPAPPKNDLIQQTISISDIRKSVALTRISLIHRLGVVGPKESSISISVSSPHRKEAFRACEWILEEVKKRAEIWKREVYEDKDDKAWKENFPHSKDR